MAASDEDGILAADPENLANRLLIGTPAQYFLSMCSLTTLSRTMSNHKTESKTTEAGLLVGKLKKVRKKVSDSMIQSGFYLP